MTAGKVVVISVLTTVGGGFLFQKLKKRVPGFNNG